MNNDDKKTKAITVPLVASGDLTNTPNNTTKLRYHRLKQILRANKDNVKRKHHYSVCLPLTETCKLNNLKLNQAPCLMTVSNENEEMCYSKHLGSVKLSNEHDKCNLNDEEEKIRTKNVSFTNHVNLETVPNSTGKLMDRKLKQILCANTVAKTCSISKHMPRTKKTTKHVYMTKIQDTPKNKCSICEQFQFVRKHELYYTRAKD